MPVPDLVGLCQKRILTNIDELSYVSTLPYGRVRNILKHVKTASQLAIIEEYSPQIVGEDSELWEAFCLRDFPVPMKRKDYQPETHRSWRLVYERYAEEERAAEEHALAQLGATYAGINKLRQQTKTAIANPKDLPRVPHTSGLGRIRGRNPTSGSAAFGSGPRIMNAVQKARKEAMEAAARKKLAVPTAMRPLRRLGQVETAPESMKIEQRIKRQPKFLPMPAKSDIKRDREEDNERQQMEARLLVAKKARLPSGTELTKSSATTSMPVRTAPTVIPFSSTTAKRSAGLFSAPRNITHDEARVGIKRVSKTDLSALTEQEPTSRTIKARLLPDRWRPPLTSNDEKRLTLTATTTPPAENRTGTPPVAGGTAPSSPSRRELDEAPSVNLNPTTIGLGAGSAGTAGQATPKKRKVDVFMRPRKPGR